jgi:uncharacterized protein with von Willebrand factor type A (vWA) domain
VPKATRRATWGAADRAAGPAGAPAGELLVDLPRFAVALARRLHAVGVPVTPERSARLAEALSLTYPKRRSELYWIARVTLVSARDQLPAFDATFRALFEAARDPADARGDPSAPPAARAGRPARDPADAPSPSEAAPHGAPTLLQALASTDYAGGTPAGREAILAVASSRERLSHRDLAALSAAEVAQVRELGQALALAPPLRRARRSRRHRRGSRADLRTTVRRSLRTGGDPVRLTRRRRRERPRRLVMICDVSGSMEPYARALVQLAQGAAGGARAEAFVFSTRLTRITRELREGQPEVAIRRAAQAASDWSGGTRIGVALGAFNDRFGRRGLARGAVVVILSDGWERDDPARLEIEMERLARLAHRIVWVNPRSAARGFAPLAGGMAAALPHCDAMVSGHDVAALGAVVDAIGGADAALDHGVVRA